MNYKKISEHITKWLKNYIQSNHLKGFVLGVSGGIDSSVVSTLCAKTGLPLLIIEMPIHQNENEVKTAKNHIKYLKERYGNVESIEIDLTKTFDDLKKEMNFDNSEKSNLSLVNTRSRLRMTTLYAYATIKNSIVCGTGNKIEDYGIKFFAKFGDGGVDINPIGDLMKSEVYKLGEELDLLDEVLNVVPTDGLWEGSPTDEEQIGSTYDELEWAMNFTEKYKGIKDGTLIKYDKEILNISDRQMEVLNIYNHRHFIGDHKMKLPPVCNIPNKLKIK